MSGFEEAVARVLEEEGGYVDHPRDPGKKTNRGVTEKTLRRAKRGRLVPHDVTIRTLSRAQAEAIYRVFYWDASGCSRLPAPFDALLFDAYVNQPPKTAVKHLQVAVAAYPDGVVGPETIAAARQFAADPEGVKVAVERFCLDRLKRYMRLKNWPTFGKGWTLRTVRGAFLAMSDVEL